MTRFHLPVFKASPHRSTAELVRLASHAEEIYERAVADAASFDFGLALLSNEFAEIAEANQVRDVAMVPGISAAQMAAQVEAAFAARNLTCHEWYFADGKVPPELRPILEARGYHLKKANLWVMQHPQNLDVRDDLTIIPGRASHQKLADLAVATEIAWGTTGPAALAQFREAAIRYLDDPQVDNLLALSDQTAVGTVYLVTSGEMGLIIDFYVHPSHTRQKVATTLLDRIIELAHRSLLRHLCLFCDADNTAARALYQKTGFAEIAEIEWMTLAE